MADSTLLELFEKPAESERTLLPQIWGWAVMVALPVVLFFLYRDMGTYLDLDARGRSRFQPDLAAWQAFFVVQLANKLPVSYRYSLRGGVAALDLAGFVLAMAAVAALAWSLPVGGPGLWLALGGVTGAWLLFQAGITAFPPRTAGCIGASIGRRLYCAFAAGLVPGAPFLFAHYLLHVSA